MNYFIEYEELKKLYQKKQIKLVERYDTDRFFELICKLASKMENKKYVYEFYVFNYPRYCRNEYLMCLRDSALISKKELHNDLYNGYSKVDPNYYVRLSSHTVFMYTYYGSLFGNSWSRHDLRPDFMDYVNCSINGGRNSYEEELFINITDSHFLEYIMLFTNYIAYWKLCNNRFRDRDNWTDYETLIEPFIEQYKEHTKLFCKK